MDNGLRFLTDQDARPAGSAHPNTHLWDNGINAAEELSRVMKIRSIVLNNFSEKRYQPALTWLRWKKYWCLCTCFTEYQVEATAKVLAGNDYSYALRGDGQTPNTPVPASEQWKALNALLATDDHRRPLALPQHVIALNSATPLWIIRPNPRETFKRYTGVTFDPLSPAEAAAGMTLGMILHPNALPVW